MLCSRISAASEPDKYLSRGLPRIANLLSDFRRQVAICDGIFRFGVCVPDNEEILIRIIPFNIALKGIARVIESVRVGSSFLKDWETVHMG